jgi:hypothetical protein
VGYSYNAVVLAAERTALIQKLKDLTRYKSRFFQAYRIARGRFAVFGWNRQERVWNEYDAQAFEDLAKELSRKFVKAVAVHFMDDMGGDCRHASLYRGGKLIRSFDEKDELYVLADSKGKALPNAPWCPWKDIPEGEQCIFVWDGIDAALEAAGFGGLLCGEGLWERVDQKDQIWEYQGDADYLWTDWERHRGLNLGFSSDVYRAWHEIRDLCSGEADFHILLVLGYYAVDALNETNVPPDVFTKAQEAGHRFLLKYSKDKRFAAEAIGMVRAIIEHKPQFKRRCIPE